MNNLFSIVITCYNYEQYVGKCIRSVLDQSLRDFELIVVNAGSTDKSQEIINSFNEVIKVSAPKGSHAIACHHGLNKCRGRWILFLDADDFLFSSALSRISEVVHPELSKIQYNLRVCDENGFYGKREMVSFPKSYNTEKIQKEYETTGTYIWPVTSGNMYSSSFLKQVFPLKPFLPIDGQLNTIAPAFGLIGQINCSLGCYRLHSQNMDNRSLNPWDSSRFNFNIKRRYREYFAARKKSLFLKRRLPLKPFINNEISFIAYRIFLKKLNCSYFMHHKENIVILFYYFFRFLLARSFTLSYSLVSLSWLLVFSLLPGHFAHLLLKHRFSRRIK